MKTIILSLSLILSPLLLIISVNEYIKSISASSHYSKNKIITINSSEKLENKCTWACHNNTTFCKETHVKYAQKHFKLIDPIYFGIIHNLKSTTKYEAANIFLFAFLIPLLMLYVLIRSILIQLKINKLGQNG